MISTAYFHPHLNPRENSLVGDFVARVVMKGEAQWDKFCSMGVFEDGQLIAGTLYHGWYPEYGIIELSSGSISKRWLTRRVVQAMFDLPFNGLGCQMVILRVSERNRPMVRIARSFGFSEVLIPRLRGRDEGEFVFTYTDDQWRSSPYNRMLP